jgi:hypothetical protein
MRPAAACFFNRHISNGVGPDPEEMGSSARLASAKLCSAAASADLSASHWLRLASAVHRLASSLAFRLASSWALRLAAAFLASSSFFFHANSSFRPISSKSRSICSTLLWEDMLKGGVMAWLMVMVVGWKKK